MRYSKLLALAILGFAWSTSAQIIQTVAGGGPVNNELATSANLNGLRGVAADSAGNIYITAQSANQVYKVNPSGVLTIVAGKGGQRGTTGDGGLAINATLNTPAGIAVDTAGNIFIADQNSLSVRRVDAITGIITRVAGGASCTPTAACGDGGLAKNAAFGSPTAVAVDPVGNFFVVDSNNRIRRVDAITGIIITVAGNGTACSPSTSACGDGGPATSANLNAVQGIAVDSADNLYIADLNDQRIRRVDGVSGVITSVAGNGTLCSNPTLPCGDGGPATSANLRNPFAVLLDSGGNLFIADGSNRVRRVDSGTGILTTVIGTGNSGYNGDNISALSANISPFSLAFDNSGNLVISDSGSVRVRRVSSGIISTVAGNGFSIFSGDGALATVASLGLASGTAFDSAGNLVIADTFNNRVRRVDAVTSVITTIAGTGLSCSRPSACGDGGQATLATLSQPRGLAFDSFGNLFIAGTGSDHSIRRVDAVTGVITAVAGTGVAGATGDGGRATLATLNTPFAVAFDSFGNLFVADFGNSRIRRVDAGADGKVTGAADEIITTVAGTTVNGFAGDGGQATSARLSSPTGVAFDSAGNLFISDRSNNRIRRVVPGADGKVNGSVDEIITTVAGGTSSFGDGGPATSAALSLPNTVAFDSAGNMFIADLGNNRIRWVVPGADNLITGASDEIITTVAGNGNLLFAGDGGPAKQASLAQPIGVAVNSSEQLFIADLSNNRIRRVDFPTNHPPVANAGPAQTVFGAYTTGANATLDGTASTDPDGDSLAYTWTGPFTGGTATGATPTVFFPMGTSSVTLTVIDSRGGISTANTQVTVTNTSVAITITTNPAVYSQNLSYNIKVTSPLGGTPTGTVSSGFPGFTPNTFNLVNGQVNFGQAAFTAIGATPFTAAYNGDSTFRPSSATTNLVVNMASTTVALTSSTNPSLPGQSVTFTATVNPVAPSLLFCWSNSTQGLTGTVQFVVDGANFGSPIALSSLCATFSNKGVISTSALTAGPHTITAVYSGSGNYIGSSATLTQTVTNPNPTLSNLSSPSIAYGTASTSFSGTVSGSSGVPTGTVTITVNGTPAVATVNPATGNFSASIPTATFGVAGSAYTVTYSYSGDATYNAHTANGSLTVTAASLSVTPANQSKTYGDTFSAFTGTSTGLQNSDPITAAYSSAGGAAAAVVAGSPYDIIATLSDPSNKLGNYTVTLNKGKLTVNPAPLSVTPDDKAKNYGDMFSAFTGMITGIKNSDNITAAYSSTGTAPGATVVGSPYDIIATFNDPGGKLPNYAVTQNKGKLIVNPAPLTITANNAMRPYGLSNPTFTAGYSSFVNGENSSVLTGTLLCTSLATANSPVGGNPYAITCTGQSSTNYAINYLPGQLTINQAPASVTPNAASKTYGTGDPAFSGTLSGFLAGDNVTATYSRTAGETVAGSPYTISATLSPASVLSNYNITYNTAAFSISRANASVTPNAASKTYGAPDPAFSGMLSGFVAGDGVAASYSRTAGETVAGSPYTISATLSPAGVLSNYNIAYNTAAFTISQASASVTANPASKSYGTADPILGGTLSGFLAADNVTATYSRIAGETVAGGPYTISATLSPAGVLGNYNVTYNTAAFSISQANASVTPNPASKSYGTADPILGGTLSGFLAADNVTATYSRIAGETVAGGPYIISATLSPAGVLSNYDITYNTAAFTIGRANASVTPNSAGKSYGTPDPAFTGTLSGFMAADNITASYARTAGESTTGSPYTISASLSPAGALGNYNITYNTAWLTIAPALLAITANNASRVYGVANPVLGFTTAGLLGGDTLASIGLSPTCGTTATPGSAAGMYPITCTGPAAAGNYTVSYQPGTLTIGRASLTITANNLSKLLNATNPALTSGVSGLVNGDTLSSIGLTPTCTTTATTTSGVGNYPITCSGPASTTNYNVTYVAGALTVQYAIAGMCDGEAGHQILQPINADGTSVWKEGRTVPAKFRVCDANGVSIGTPGVVSSFYITQIIAGTVTNVDETVSSTTPDTAFRWDSSAQQWIFNISTSSMAANKTYVFTISLNDGSKILFQFGLK